jgi:hypothetical protein
LGVIEEVSVTFDKTAIFADMVVTPSASYDAILGIDWLQRANAVVDLGKKEMVISKHGRSTTIPLDTNRGIRRAITTRTQGEEDEGSDQEDTVFTTWENNKGLKHPVQEWKKLAKKNKGKGRAPNPSPPISNSEDNWPTWQKAAAQNYLMDEVDVFVEAMDCDSTTSTPSEEITKAEETSKPLVYEYFDERLGDWIVEDEPDKDCSLPRRIEEAKK